jgi:hypothetical protein
MTARRKAKTKHTKQHKKAAKSRRPGKKPGRKKLPKKAASATKKLAKKRPSLKKATVKARVAAKQKAGLKTATSTRKPAPRENRGFDSQEFAVREPRSRATVESGDLQGLSNLEAADSESVDELLEEGNAFEADVVAGVQRADDDGEREVRTHEVPEDDVPGEYLDEE